jgi:hypothetical protein
MRLPKNKLPKGTSHLKFKKHKKSCNHLENAEVEKLKASLKKEAAKSEDNMDTASDAASDATKPIAPKMTIAERAERLDAKLDRKKIRIAQGRANNMHSKYGRDTNKNGPRAI